MQIAGKTHGLAARATSEHGLAAHATFKPTGGMPALTVLLRAAFRTLDKRRLRGSVSDIMTLTEIKAEIPKLTLAEQMELAETLHGALDADEDALDAQIRADIEARGPLYQMGQKALVKLRRGECLPGWP